jgi:hypothetical protein
MKIENRKVFFPQSLNRFSEVSDVYRVLLRINFFLIEFFKCLVISHSFYRSRYLKIQIKIIGITGILKFNGKSSITFQLKIVVENEEL